MSNQQSPLRLYLLDINSQNKAILEFFVAGAGRNFYTLVNNIEQAEVFITDFDFPEARQNWQELNISGKPSLVLSMRDPDIPDVEWLSKPMTSDALIDAAKKYMGAEGRDSSNDSNPSVSHTSKMPFSKPLSHDRIGSRISASSNLLGAGRKVPKTVKPSSASLSLQENIGLQGKPLVGLDEGDTATLERPATKADNLREEAKQVEAKELATDGFELDAFDKLVSDDVLESLEHDEDTSNIETNEAETVIDAVDDEEKESLTEEQVLDELRHSSPIFVREKSSPEKARLRWQELCGTHPDADYTPSDLKDIRNTGYNCESHLEGSLIAALRLSKQTHQAVQVKYEPYDFFMFYEEGLIISKLDPKSPEFTMLCANAVRPGQINLHILDSEHSKKIQDNLENRQDSAFELESFIWTVCLVSSQGRLPTSFEYERPYLLKHWPNFTRMENFPFAMKIAALWHYEANKLSEVAEKLEIPQRYIVAFYNAAMGLSLFEQDPDKIQKKLVEPPKKKRSGIIARLFSRLAGGMNNA